MVNPIHWTDVKLWEWSPINRLVESRKFAILDAYRRWGHEPGSIEKGVAAPFVALFSYVTVQMVRNGFDMFWLVSPEGSMTWELFVAVMVIDLLIPVFEKATELV